MATVNIFDMADTWSDAGTTYTAIKMDVTDTASASGSLLMDLQVGGTSKFKVGKNGAITTSAATSNHLFARGSTGTVLNLYASGSAFQPTLQFQNNTGSAFLTFVTTANLRLGAADAAAPVAQTFSVQSVVAGTTNTSGTDFTIEGSQGTGTGDGGSIIFKVAPAGSSGSTQNAFIDGLTINSTGDTTTNTLSVNSVGTNVPQGNGLGSIATSLLAIRMGSAWTFGTGTDRFVLPSSSWLGFSSLAGTDNNMASSPNVDTRLYRDASNTLALRNSTNAQTFNIYNTFTDASNYERGFMKWNSNVLEIGTEAAGSGTARTLRFFNSASTQLNMTIDPAGATIGLTRSGLNYIRATNTTSGSLAFGTSGSGGRVDSIVVTSSAVEIREDVILMANLPTADPSNPGQLWNDAGTLKVS